MNSLNSVNSQVTNSRNIAQFFKTTTKPVLSTIPSLHYTKALVTGIVSRETRISYLEPDELSNDFTQLITPQSSTTTTLFGNVTSESTQFPPIIVNNSINAYICIYSINETSIPFFEYLFTQNEGSIYAEFPKVIIDLPPSPQTDDSNQFIKTYIMNRCIEYIIDIFKLPIETINNDFLNNFFKGFILKPGSNSNTIYLFFNGTNFDYTYIFSTKKIEELNKEDNTTVPFLFKNAILDEIINKQCIGETEVLKEIVDLFKENTFINTISLKDNYNSLKKFSIVYPHCLYLCESVESTTETDRFIWSNVSIDDTTDKKTVNFTLLGDFYYFSSTFLKKRQSEQKPEWKRDEYKKYAVFLDINNGKYPIEESYIVKDLTTITKEKLDTYFQKLNPANISTIWFKYNGLQMWAIKYPSQIICINSI